MHAHVAVLPDADCGRCYCILQGLAWREWHLGLSPRAPPPGQRPQRWLTLLRYKAYARGALATLTCVRALVPLLLQMQMPQAAAEPCAGTTVETTVHGLSHTHSSELHSKNLISPPAVVYHARDQSL